MSLYDLMKAGRKIGCTTYSYHAKKVGVVGSENPKIIVTARNDLTGNFIMDEKTDLNTIKEHGLPLPGLSEIVSEKK